MNKLNSQQQLTLDAQMYDQAWNTLSSRAKAEKRDGRWECQLVRVEWKELEVQVRPYTSSEAAGKL
jgi:hypothetical protein